MAAGGVSAACSKGHAYTHNGGEDRRFVMERRREYASASLCYMEGAHGRLVGKVVRAPRGRPALEVPDAHYGGKFALYGVMHATFLQRRDGMLLMLFGEVHLPVRSARIAPTYVDLVRYLMWKYHGRFTHYSEDVLSPTLLRNPQTFKRCRDITVPRGNNDRPGKCAMHVNVATTLELRDCGAIGVDPRVYVNLSDNARIGRLASTIRMFTGHDFLLGEDDECGGELSLEGPLRDEILLRMDNYGDAYDMLLDYAMIGAL